MRVLGVDPGTRVAGYGVLDRRADGSIHVVAFGVIRAQTKVATELGPRLLRVFQGMQQIIEAYQPSAFAIEEAFVWKNPKSALAIGHGRAAAILAASEKGLAIHAYQPTIVKKAVTGSGRAKKEQVQAMVAALLGLDAPPEPADAADALAVAFAHLHRSRLDAVIRRAT